MENAISVPLQPRKACPTVQLASVLFWNTCGVETELGVRKFNIHLAPNSILWARHLSSLNFRVLT